MCAFSAIFSTLSVYRLLICAMRRFRLSILCVYAVRRQLRRVHHVDDMSRVNWLDACCANKIFGQVSAESYDFFRLSLFLFSYFVLFDRFRGRVHRVGTRSSIVTFLECDTYVRDVRICCLQTILFYLFIWFSRSWRSAAYQRQCSIQFILFFKFFFFHFFFRLFIHFKTFSFHFYLIKHV